MTLAGGNKVDAAVVWAMGSLGELPCWEKSFAGVKKVRQSVARPMHLAGLAAAMSVTRVSSSPWNLSLLECALPPFSAASTAVLAAVALTSCMQAQCGGP